MARKAKPQNQKIADALGAAHRAAEGGSVLHSRSITRTTLELLKVCGWLMEVHGGWYALVHPGSQVGDTVPFYSNYWEFVRKYLGERLGRDYALSPAASLALYSDSYSIPRQLAVSTAQKTRGIIELPFGSTLAIYDDSKFAHEAVTDSPDGLRILKLENALASMPAASYRLPSPELIAAVSSVRNIPDLTRLLLRDQSSLAAGRLTDALRGAGRETEATSIESAFTAAGFTIAPDVLVSPSAFTSLLGRPKSGISARLSAMWRVMSEQLDGLNLPPSDVIGFKNKDFSVISQHIKDVYVNDAYNSLSIEGYRVTQELIRRVASGEWNPELNAQDKQSHDTLAARGYYEAFESVIKVIEKLHGGADTVSTLEKAVFDWRSSLFGPLSRAGVLPSEALAGYRNKPVFIRTATHVPPAPEKLMDAMDTLFECMRVEEHPWKRALLSHFLFVNIHPFSDGNGRVGRFLMNSLLVSAGYDWTVVRMSHRPTYFTALETASTGGDVRPFGLFIESEMLAKGEEPRPSTDGDKRAWVHETAGSRPPSQVGHKSQVVAGSKTELRRSDCLPPGCSDGPLRPRRCVRHRD